MQIETQTNTSEKRYSPRNLRDTIKVRLATDAAGPEIAELLKANGHEIPLADWSKISPHWLIATTGDQIIGCVQVMPSLPVGYADWLYVLPTLKFKTRAIAIHKLIYAAIATVKMHGAAYIVCLTDKSNAKFAGVLSKMNFIPVSENTRVVKRLIGD